ncbi:triose-phosphate isomerase [Chlorobium sp. BLA1]|uniref:triose-phosphate isomerase n=1 Tax=Candidatus Chlorobium masyuteum TaxID=2716876 RepID=UPI001421C9DF|nr:triose-phosphate isomerase [Candidatus Chlorobium masyuteum]NHQ61182.1 triose-phosphate isomerase [Candidatus Chlorobium masyuteum]NTU44423.1 triose-phosphate isomerase [Chlorobiaceae bacterium]
MRQKIVVGNWKMNNTIAESAALASELVAALGKDFSGCEVGIAPTYVALQEAGKIIAGSAVQLVAQNCHFENDGAFTGEVSTGMLKAVGCSYVIIGHSERRQFFGETNATVNLRIKKALAEGLKVILCVGETLAERESEVTSKVVTSQVTEGLAGISDISTIVIAYEPVWAIGTGKTASSAQAEEVHLLIRNTITKLYGDAAAGKLRIQYGGSVKPSNAAELFAMPNIDGGLIGGASLNAADFAAIIKAAS